MKHTDTAEAFEGDLPIPNESGIPVIGYGYEAAQRSMPLRLVLDRDTLTITYDMIRVTAQAPECRSDDKVPVIVIYTPEGEVRWDPIFVHGKLKMVFGFVPDVARLTVAALFRYNDTITVS